MKNILLVGAVLALMLFSAAANATTVPDVCDSTWTVIVEAQNENGDFYPTDTFETSEDVYVSGFMVGDNVNVYVTVDRNWSNNDNITAVANVKNSKLNQNIPTPETYIKMGSFDPGKYDVVVDRNRDGLYTKDCDAVDSATILGFQVLPELATIGLLGLGIVSMTGYFALSRKK
jgi:hypothetical protein